MVRINTRFLFREMVHGRHHAVIFILCVALSLTSMVALNSFKGAVTRSLFEDSRELHGADIVVHSHYPFSSGTSAEVARLASEGLITASTLHEYYSVVRKAGGDGSLLAKIKSVDRAFPLYGRIELLSGNSLADSLVAGTCIAGENVLARLGLRVGDFLKVGSTSLKITDVVVYESDSPVSLLNFGPRVFVSEDDLDTIDLVRKGSRVKYEILLKLTDQKSLEAVSGRLKAAAVQGQERVNTFLEAESRVKRFFDNLLFFLSLTSIFTLFLAGLGMQSCLTALLRQKQKTIAVCRVLGASNRFVHSHYFLLVLILGAAGAVLGTAAGVGTGLFLPRLFADLLPVHGSVTVMPYGIGEGLLFGFLVVLLFTFLPLYRLREIKPAAILRHEVDGEQRRLGRYIAVGCSILLTGLLVIRYLEDIIIGMYFLAAVLTLLCISYLLAHVLLYCSCRVRTNLLPLRQALRSMTRRGGSTRSVVVTFVASMSLLFAIYLIDYNLKASFIESYPEDAPNLFCIDIQADQRQEFLEFFTNPPDLHPVIRARLMEINGDPVNRNEELKKKRDNFAREFNLTYRDYLLEDERLAAGDSLFPKQRDGRAALQVSILDSVAEMGDLKVNDVIRFNIQGVYLEAEVTSIRTRTKSRLYPFFYFVFPPEYLNAAPQTFFASIHLEQEEIAPMQNRIVEKLPNISFINVSETAKKIGVIMEKLTRIITFFASFSIAAGALILLSSIRATRLERVRESVYFMVLGARSGFVYRVFALENGLIGLFSGLTALGLAQICSWLVCRFVYEIGYMPNPAASMLLLSGAVLFVTVAGMLGSYSIVREKPAKFLREYGDG